MGIMRALSLHRGEEVNTRNVCYVWHLGACPALEADSTVKIVMLPAWNLLSCERYSYSPGCPAIGQGSLHIYNSKLRVRLRFAWSLLSDKVPIINSKNNNDDNSSNPKA